MAPEVGSLHPIERTKGLQFFAVNLQHKDVGLDITLFDSQLRKVAVEMLGGGMAKFIVANDQMLIFSSQLEHSIAYAFIKGLPNWDFKSPEIQCAGHLSFRNGRDKTAVQARKIYGYSTSLIAKGLRMTDSNEYKMTTLKEILGDQFVIE